MAGKTIGQLTAATSITTADKIEIEQDGSSKYGTVSLLAEKVVVGYVEVTENYEVVLGDRTLIITTADAVIITIPEGLPVGTDLKISRTVASTNAVTVAKTGSDTIEGGATFVTHGAFAASTLNDAEVVIKKKFVSGIVSGSTSDGMYTQYPNGDLHQFRKDVNSGSIDVTTGTGSVYGSSELGVGDTWIKQFTSLTYAFVEIQYTSLSRVWKGVGLTDGDTTNCPSYFIFRSVSGSISAGELKVIRYGIGRWR